MADPASFARKRLHAAKKPAESPAGASTPVALESSVRLEGRILHIDTTFAELDARGLVPERISAVAGKAAVWNRALKDEEIASGSLRIDLSSLFKRKAVEDGAAMELVIGTVRRSDGEHVRIALEPNAPGTGNPDDCLGAMIGVAVYRPPKSADDDDTIFGEYVCLVRERIEKDDDAPAIAVFKNSRGGLGLLAGFRNSLLTGAKWAELDSVSAAHGRVRIRAHLDDGAYIVEDFVLRLRSTTDPVEIGIPYTLSYGKDGRLAFEAAFDPAALPLREIYWDCCIVVRTHGMRALVPLRMGDAERLRLRLGNQQWRLPDGKVLFTHIAKGNALAFVYRDYYPAFDTMAFRAKELAALGAFTALHPYWKRKRIWLVYEKFCKLAQDNGFYFFEYCMGLPESARKHIYYVIDKSQPDYANVAPYDGQVIDFGSFKHLLYDLAAKIYVGSDSQSHLYIWRPKPSFLRMRVRRHKILFLQHGVTALKRDDELFGKKGTSPMTYYLTTSQNEQDVITQNFGYTEQQAPILGFSRWDVIEDRSSAAEPTILLMPTWRPWLEEQGDELFCRSEYFKAYSSLIQSPALAQVLERYNARLRFFIHPKLSEHLGNFDVASSRIELVPQGSEQLNFAMMECSMLITDYSSVCWDVLYMDKPVVFYQFDQKLYNRVTGSYIDLGELPGDVCTTEAEAIAAIEACAERGFALADEHAQRARGWFAHKDRNNRERTFDFLVNKGF